MRWLVALTMVVLVGYAGLWFIYQLGTYLHIKRVGIITDCRDPDHEGRGCTLVRYVGPAPANPSHTVDLKLHGNSLDVLKAWRDAAVKGLVPQDSERTPK